MSNIKERDDQNNRGYGRPPLCDRILADSNCLEWVVEANLVHNSDGLLRELTGNVQKTKRDKHKGDTGKNLEDDHPANLHKRCVGLVVVVGEHGWQSEQQQWTQPRREDEPLYQLGGHEHGVP